MESKQNTIRSIYLGLLSKTQFLFVTSAADTPAPAKASVFSMGYSALAYGVLLALLVYRLIMIMQPHVSLFFDEAYYFHWSQSLDFGYYSKPPMVAWLIGVSTKLIGVSDFAIKFFSPVAYTLTGFLVFLIARTQFGARVALYAATIFSTAPLVGFNSLFITTDAPLFLFWALSLYFMMRCEAHAHWSDWLSLGMCLGLGMLSKYTFALLPLGFLGYIATTGQWQTLTRKGFWCAVVIGVGLASTNWWWNYAHDFVAFSHTQEIARHQGRLFNLSSLLEFFATQLVIFGIGVSLSCILTIGLINWATIDNKRLQLLLWVSLPILIVIALQSLLSRAFANWAGPYMIGMSILAALVLSNISKKIVVFAIAFNISLLSAFYHLPSIYYVLNIEQSKKNSPFARIAGWNTLSNDLAEMLEVRNITSIISPSRDILAYVGYYARVDASSLYFWNPDRSNIRNQYDLANDINNLSVNNKTVLFISNEPVIFNILDNFETSEFIGLKEKQIMKGVTRRLYLYEASGFKGYHDE